MSATFTFKIPLAAILYLLTYSESTAWNFHLIVTGISVNVPVTSEALLNVAENIQLFWERLTEKMCSRQPRKVIWDMINTLFWTTVAVEPLYFCCFPLALMNICPWPIVLFFQISLENSIQNHPQIIPIGIVACFFPTTFLETTVCPKMFWQPLSTYEAIKKVTILVCCDSQLRDKVIIKHLFAKFWRNWIEFPLLIIC